MYPDSEDQDQNQGMTPIVPPSAGPYKSSLGSRLGNAGMMFAKGLAQSSPVGSLLYGALAPQPKPVQGPPPGAGGIPISQLPQPLPVTQAPGPPPDVPAPPAGSAWGQSAPKTPWASALKKQPQPQNLATPGAGAAASGQGSQDASAQASSQGVPMTGGGAPNISEDLMGDLPEFAGLLGGGKLVTKPTLAKIGEKGPEAVVPLTPRPGNKLGPDLLEGRLRPPVPKGLHYSEYHSFSGSNPLR